MLPFEKKIQAAAGRVWESALQPDVGNEQSNVGDAESIAVRFDERSGMEEDRT